MAVYLQTGVNSCLSVWIGRMKFRQKKLDMDLIFHKEVTQSFSEQKSPRQAWVRWPFSLLTTLHRISVSGSLLIVRWDGRPYVPSSPRWRPAHEPYIPTIKKCTHAGSQKAVRTDITQIHHCQQTETLTIVLFYLSRKIPPLYVQTRK